MRFIRMVVFAMLYIPAISVAKNVTIIANIPFITPADANIYLTGDWSGLCSWRPDCLKMDQLAPGSYSIVLTIPEKVEKINYKITRGTWDTEAADSNSVAYNNFSIALNNTDLPIVHNVIHWKDLPPLGKTSNVLDTFNLYSAELGANKRVSVYLPPSYNSSDKDYPVIYMHDGQNVFDPTLASFGVEWSIDETMNKLIETNNLNEAIIVAIHTNNTDRIMEYDYFVKGKNYSDFIVNSVIPFAEKNFRVKKNKESRFLMGSSMGALISLMMLIDRPDIFSKGAGLSFPADIHNRSIPVFKSQMQLFMD